jgi:ribosomal protein uL22
MEHNYAFKANRRGRVVSLANGGEMAKASKRGVDASYKDLCEVCSNVRGMDAQSALAFLELAAKKEVAIRFYRHNAGMGHRKQLGGAKGGWPVKSVKIVKEVLENAIANGKSLASPYVAHIQANKQDILPRMSPKGRRMRMDYETAFVEIVLLERPGAKKGADEKKAKPEKKETKTEMKIEKDKVVVSEKKSEEEKETEQKKEEKAAEKLAQKAEDAASKSAVHTSQHVPKKPM